MTYSKTRLTKATSITWSSQDNAVGIVTTFRAGQSQNCGSINESARIFSPFSQQPGRPWDPCSLYSLGTGRSFVGCKMIGVRNWPLTPSSSAEIRNAQNCISVPPLAFMAWYLIMDSDTLSCTLLSLHIGTRIVLVPQIICFDVRCPFFK
jgi:hypothetical protein